MKSKFRFSIHLKGWVLNGYDINSIYMLQGFKNTQNYTYSHIWSFSLLKMWQNIKASPILRDISEKGACSNVWLWHRPHGALSVWDENVSKRVNSQLQEQLLGWSGHFRGQLYSTLEETQPQILIKMAPFILECAHHRVNLTNHTSVSRALELFYSKDWYSET